jgi:fatty acid amide hydrolase
LEALQWQPGPLARRVDDLELLLRVLVDESSTDPEVLPAPQRACRRDVRGLRIAFWDDNGFFPYAPAVKRAVREAVAALAEQGAIVEELTPPKISEAMFLFTALMAADGAADAERLVRGSKVDPRVTQLLLAGRIPNRLRGLAAWFYEKSGALHKAGLIRAARSRSADEVWQLTKHLSEYRYKFLDAFAAGYDALVLPVYALPAPRHGQVLDLVPAASDTIFVNLLGVPSGCVPVTAVRAGEETARAASRELAAATARSTEAESAGLPIGVQVVSHFWREEIVLDVMRAIEAGCEGSRAPVLEIAGSPAP